MRIQPIYTMETADISAHIVPPVASSDPWEWPAALPGRVYIPTYDEEYKARELLK